MRDILKRLVNDVELASRVGEREKELALEVIEK